MMASAVMIQRRAKKTCRHGLTNPNTLRPPVSKAAMPTVAKKYANQPPKIPDKNEFLQIDGTNSSITDMPIR